MLLQTKQVTSLVISISMSDAAWTLYKHGEDANCLFQWNEYNLMICITKVLLESRVSRYNYNPNKPCLMLFRFQIQLVLINDKC